LECIVTEFSGIIGNCNFRITIDKAFYSHQNIEFLLKKKDLSFLIAVPFTEKFALETISRLRNSIENFDNIIFSTNNNELLRCITEFVQWENFNKKIFVHIFFNPTAELHARNELYKKIDAIRNRAVTKPNDKKNKILMENYFIYKKIKNGDNIELKNEVIEKELSTSGLFILISNDINKKRIKTSFSIRWLL
jgi:hypothetical protein